MNYLKPPTLPLDNHSTKKSYSRHSSSRKEQRSPTSESNRYKTFQNRAYGNIAKPNELKQKQKWGHQSDTYSYSDQKDQLKQLSTYKKYHEDQMIDSQVSHGSHNSHSNKKNHFSNRIKQFSQAANYDSIKAMASSHPQYLQSQSKPIPTSTKYKTFRDSNNVQPQNIQINQQFYHSGSFKYKKHLVDKKQSNNQQSIWAEKYDLKKLNAIEQSADIEKIKQKYSKPPKYANNYKTQKIQKIQKTQKIDKFQKVDKSQKSDRNKVGHYLNQKHFSSLSVNKFQKIRNLGQGSYSHVYLVREIDSKMLYALKVMSKDRIKLKNNQENIFRQLKIQTYLNHPNIIKLYATFCDQNNVYLVTQYLNGGTLFDFKQSKQGKRLNQKKTAKYIKQLIDAIKYMHQENIIHRDIKLQNIMLCNDVAKIGDLGCAVHTVDMRKTKIGTPAYYSPEQLKLGLYDEKVDVWCLGILTYELLFGTAPYDEDIVRILRQQQTELSNLKFVNGIHISNDAKNFIIKLLEKDPYQRLRLNDALHHPFITKNSKEDLSLIGF